MASAVEAEVLSHLRDGVKPSGVPQFLGTQHAVHLLKADAFEQFHRPETQGLLGALGQGAPRGVQGLADLIEVEGFPAVDKPPADQFQHQLLTGGWGEGNEPGLCAVVEQAGAKQGVEAMPCLLPLEGRGQGGLEQPFELLDQVLVHPRSNLACIAQLHLFDQTIQPRTLQVGVEALAGRDGEIGGGVGGQFKV